MLVHKLTLRIVYDDHVEYNYLRTDKHRPCPPSRSLRRAYPDKSTGLPLLLAPNEVLPVSSSEGLLVAGQCCIMQVDIILANVF